jgi:glucokinase
MEKRKIGVDIGGTTISFIDCRARNSIQGRREMPVPADRDGIVSVIASTVKDLLDGGGEKPAGIGVAVAGQVGKERRSVIFSPNLPFKKEFPLAEKLEEAIGLDVRIENDANSAAIGEKIFGEAKEMDDFISLTLGTGIGSGIFSGGRLLRGDTGGGGEAGHIIVNSEGPICGCGNFGCLEAYSSGKAIEGMAKEFTGRKMTAREVCEAAERGNDDATALLNYAGERLGDGLVTLINLFNPEAIFFCGSLSSGPIDYFGPALEKGRMNRFGTTGEKIKIEVSELSDVAGLLGAAALFETGF